MDTSNCCSESHNISEHLEIMWGHELLNLNGKQKYLFYLDSFSLIILPFEHFSFPQNQIMSRSPLIMKNEKQLKRGNQSFV